MGKGLTYCVYGVGAILGLTTPQRPSSLGAILHTSTYSYSQSLCHSTAPKSLAIRYPSDLRIVDPIERDTLPLSYAASAPR
jgi:hypothetical protein